jgi:hypothetical protein
MPPTIRAELDDRPSYPAAAIVSGAVLLLYIFTLAPSTAMWDTSEYIAAAYTLGIPHPPGNPLFVLLGRLFSMLPIAPTVAMRVNLLAAVCSSVSAGMWFLITERVLVGWFAERWQRITGGALAALIGATAFTVWSQSVVNEKVYTVSLVGVALCSWLTVRWCDDPDGPKSDRLLILVAYLLGLGYSVHMAGFLAAPAVTAAVLIRRPGVLLRFKFMAGIAGAILLGMTPFITQPIRAAYFPAINEGEPTGCIEGIAVGCTFSGRTVDAFMYNFNRGQYDKPPLTERMAPFTAQVGMWWMYFKWQWIRDPDSKTPPLQAMFAAIFFMLGLFGGYVHWRRDRRSFSYFGPLMLTMTFVLIYYLNFKYGYSQAPDLGESVPREVRDRDYFYLWSFSAWSVWAALGLVFVWESIAQMIGSEKIRLGADLVDLPRKQSWITAAPVLLIAFVPLAANWAPSTRKGDTVTRDFAADLLNSVEPYGVLVTVGDNDTFPLWYAQEVEGIRRDVVVANTSLLNTDWYTRQLIRRPIFEYDAAKGPAIYRNQQWKKPTSPVIHMTLQQADSIPLIQSLGNNRTLQKDSLVATVKLQSLYRADYVVLRMILDEFPDRPIYFSRTSGNYAEDLGLQDYFVTQGLARKLLPHLPHASAELINLPSGEGWLDLPRTEALWKEVFIGPEAIARKGRWVDRASVGIPWLYLATAAVLGEAMEHANRSAAGDSVVDRAMKVATATGLSDIFGRRAAPRAPPPPTGLESALNVKPGTTPAKPPAGRSGRGRG